MNTWLDKLERKFGRYAIPELMKYIIALYAIGFIILYADASIYYNYLSLDAAAILHGQVWRILTFIIYPPSTSILWVLIALSLYYFIGIQLERVWGSFRFNLYYFSGVLLHALAAILVYLMTGDSYFFMDTTYLNLSLFMVFAMIFPDIKFMVYFIIPVKGKWLAALDGLYFAWTIIQAFLPAYGGNPAYGMFYRANAVAAFVSMLNFLVFLLGSGFVRTRSPKQVVRQAQYKKKVEEAKKEHYDPKTGAFHRCAVCGRTELDDPNLEFRYCSKCNGNLEFCQDHLFTHQHRI
ncbi:MAG: hypothetical protein MJ097_01905 [Dorea sp.]|nr:hypothetical protein [Dorea sp.]